MRGRVIVGKEIGALCILLLSGSIPAADKPVEEWIFPKREVHRETTFVAQNKALGAVVYPAGKEAYRGLAERVAGAVKKATGVPLPVLTDKAATTEWCGAIKPEYRRRPLVVLGDINANRATFPIYSLYLCECDANYPGKGGRVVRTVFAPYHYTANFILLAGPGIEETTAASERFIETIQKHGRPGLLTIPPLLDLKLGAAWQDMARRAASEKPVDASKRNVGTMGIAAAARRYLITGELAPAQTVRNWFVHRAKVPRGYVTSDYQMEALTRAWELTCDSGIYTADEIRNIETKLLHTLFYQQNQYWRRSGPRESLGTRHQVAGSFAFLTLAEALRRHCPDDTDVAKRLDRWIAEVKSYFACFPARRSYHGERDSNSVFQVMGLLFQYAFREGELDIFKNGTARQGIRKAVAVMDNLGYGAGLQDYEDTYPGHVRTSYLTGEPLALAAFYYRDPHMKWLTQNWPGCDFRTWFAHGSGIEHTYATGDTLDATSPTGPDFRGFVAAAALGDRLERNRKKGRTKVSKARAFDKLCLREAFDPKATYLCVQGMEPLMDWRDDANCIVRMTERGRICLFHNNKWPSRFHKNGVLVSPGFSTPPPRAARLDLVANFDGAALAQTALSDYRGTEWVRRIMWVKGGFTLVFDDVIVQQPGEYSALCAWRTPVPATLDGRRWSSRLRGVDFHVVSDALLPATTQTEPMVGWEVGLRGSGLRQIQHVTAAKGDVVRFRNLLYTDAADAPAGLDIRRVNDHIVAVVSKDARWLAGRGPVSVDGIETDAAMFVIGPSRAFLARATSLRIGGKTLWQAPKPSDAVVDTNVAGVLEAIWSGAGNPTVAPPPAGPATGPFRVAWTYDDFLRPPAPIPGIKVTARGGNATGMEFIADGEFPMHLGQCARFDGAPDLVVDLCEVTRVTGIRLWTRCRKNAPPAGERAINARIAFSDSPEFAGAKEQTIALKPAIRFCELYKTEMYACRIQEAMSLDATARFVRIVLPDTVKQIAELEVLGADKAPADLLEVCAADLDGQGDKEFAVTARTGEVTALDASGKKLWSKQLPGEPLSLTAGDFNGNGRDEVMVSALDGGVHWFDAEGADHHIPAWPQKCGKVQYDLEFGLPTPGKPRPLFTSSYYDIALLRFGAEPLSQYAYGMWDYDLLAPTRDLDGKGGPDLIVHDIYGRTTCLDSEGLKPGRVWSSVRGRLSHWRLIDAPGAKLPRLLVVGWDGLAMYEISPTGRPTVRWRQEDGVRLFCATVTNGDRILVGRADGFIAEFDLNGKLVGCHWVGWPVKAIVQIRKAGKQTYVLAGTDGGVFCFDGSWKRVQTLPGACVRLLPVGVGVVALFHDGEVRKLVLAD
ncbi:MAG: hypothetical protein GXP25_07615 [Planctomycetes bacterium]|nr:hypothetical protein [Planctomycetota bacterium]